jgi:hypothetical protein
MRPGDPGIESNLRGKDARQSIDSPVADFLTWEK